MISMVSSPTIAKEMGIPFVYENKPVQTILEASADKLKSPFITVSELAKEVGGWKPEVE